jgi:hypothetical protein
MTADLREIKAKLGSRGATRKVADILSAYFSGETGR